MLVTMIQTHPELYPWADIFRPFRAASLVYTANPALLIERTLRDKKRAVMNEDHLCRA